MMKSNHQSPMQRSPDEWAIHAKGMLKAELTRRDIGYQQLVQLLRGIGIQETPENLANKINRGKFSAVFLLQCLEAIGCKNIRISDE